jgi:putative endonuclease
MRSAPLIRDRYRCQVWDGPASAVQRFALHRVRDTGISMDRSSFVYILSNRPRGVMYVGVTNDLTRRISEHKGKLVPGFTRTHGITVLVYFEEYASILEAREREAVLKRWRRQWKFELIEKLNPKWRDLTGEIAS